MLEYARGVIPSTILFATGDSLLSTFDLATVFKSVSTYAKMLLYEAAKLSF